MGRLIPGSMCWARQPHRPGPKRSLCPSAPPTPSAPPCPPRRQKARSRPSGPQPGACRRAAWVTAGPAGGRTPASACSQYRPVRLPAATRGPSPTDRSPRPEAEPRLAGRFGLKGAEGTGSALSTKLRPDLAHVGLPASPGGGSRCCAMAAACWVFLEAHPQQMIHSKFPRTDSYSSCLLSVLFNGRWRGASM